jgi:hypothetical protein
MKDFAKPIAEAHASQLTRSWGVAVEFPAADRRFPLPEAKLRVEVGTAAKAVKDWCVMIQYDAVVAGMLKDRRYHIGAPFTIRYRPTPDAAPVEVYRGTAETDAVDQATAIRFFCEGGARSYAGTLSRVLADRVFADKPTIPKDGERGPFAFAPVTVDLKANPPTATLRLHNKLPMAVHLMVQLQGKFAPVAGDQFFVFPPPNGNGTPMPLVLEAGEQKTVTVSLNGLKPGQEPRWCQLSKLNFVHRAAVPKP